MTSRTVFVSTVAEQSVNSCSKISLSVKSRSYCNVVGKLGCVNYRLVGTVRRHCTSQGWNGALPYCNVGKLGCVIYRLVGTVRGHCTSQGWNGTLPYVKAIGKLGYVIYRLVGTVRRYSTS